MVSSEFALMPNYAKQSIILTTKHAKSLAIGPSFWNYLQCAVIEYVVDTDKYGTFSGEIERIDSALACARKKCLIPFDKHSNVIQFALASEGSFGPHPYMPFIPCDHEILYFIDRLNNFELHVSTISNITNYSMRVLHTVDELWDFVSKVSFPSHAVIMSPNGSKKDQPIFKGLQEANDLEAVYKECQKESIDGKVYIETDMRAQFNPMRMVVIADLAAHMAQRLATNCPGCNLPGFGVVDKVTGLPCSCCGLSTELVKQQILGCVKCAYKIKVARSDGMLAAAPEHCHNCNP